MKKTFFVIFSALISVCIFSVGAFAYDGAESNNKTNELIDEFSTVIPDGSGISLDGDKLINGIGFESILAEIADAIAENGSDFLSFFFMLLGFAILSTVADLSVFSSENATRGVGVGIFVIMSVCIYPRIYALFQSVSTSLESISSFFGTAAPIMTAITTASGSVKSAGVQAMNMNIALGVVGTVAVKLLLPLSFSLLALALVCSFGDSAPFTAIKGIKSCFTFGLGAISAISSAAIALQSVIASASDSAALRAARYAAGGLIPAVGSSVSSAIATLAGGLAYAKSTVGAAAITVIVVLATVPLVSLILYRLAFSTAVFFLEYVDNNRGARCFSAYRTAIDAVIAVYVMSTLVCIIQIIVFMKGGASTN